ncbi:MAG: STAS domain-containing protein [Chitinophagales bacterium]|nr:STAS domain-containing protein [Chitinophagales bacterium]
MEYTIDRQDKATVIALKGSLLADLQTKDILQTVTDLIQENKVNFVVDLGDLKFINSAGLGMLLTCLTKARKAGGDVLLADVPEQVSNLLVITKLNAIFHTKDTVKSAIDSF